MIFEMNGETGLRYQVSTVLLVSISHDTSHDHDQVLHSHTSDALSLAVRC